MHYVPLPFQCIHKCSDEGDKNRDEEVGKVDIEWPLICRLLGIVWLVEGRGASLKA